MSLVCIYVQEISICADHVYAKVHRSAKVTMQTQAASAEFLQTILSPSMITLSNGLVLFASFF